MFTDPPLAKIGAPSSVTTVTGTGSYADQGRAKVEARNAGLIQIFADGASGTLTGAVIPGPGGGSHRTSVGMSHRTRRDGGARPELPFYHPTFQEGLKSPLREICELVGAEIDHLDDVGPPGA
jgi:dihydrolipoamide dehydrogenase